MLSASPAGRRWEEKTTTQSRCSFTLHFPLFFKAFPSLSSCVLPTSPHVSRRRQGCSKCLRSRCSAASAGRLAADGSQDTLNQLIKLALVALQSALKVTGKSPVDMNGFWSRVDPINLHTLELLRTQLSPAVIAARQPSPIKYGRQTALLCLIICAD